MGSLKPDGPRVIRLSLEERLKGTYSLANLQSALEGLHQDGLLVLESAVGVDHVDQLNTFMTNETASILKAKDPDGTLKAFNQGVKSNILHGPPVNNESLLFNDVYFNPFVIQIANAYLGSRPISNFMTGNNALPGTHGLRQPVHKDIRFHHPLAPFYFIANIPLCDFGPANGSTEFWLGSHQNTTSFEQQVATAADADEYQMEGDPMCALRPEVVEARRKIRPPIQPIIKKGDIVIRDLRLWHAGMPNETETERIMIAIGYQAPWYPNLRQRHILPVSRCNFFQAAGGQPVELRANFVSDAEAESARHNETFDFRPSM
ncbi:uncharacterized protein Z518_03714 [Rhinocladiella mackenziei CBS 650.93]|uniref:Phytanoyl-CoA dioxygenase n=1 Tax=Rhinocladiella mackenziei CBS 650.93 TaxID=1442369 RepID=A0A0D2FUG1_9EURO|nr:uncharacterized protein Z518_03714 [Rhinocladiella mackenziei CBS 650.93]KIX05742.1 hypothetical protein Z518_03714 [Rhinocladiella mackenziei CBS 650.93]